LRGKELPYETGVETVETVLVIFAGFVTGLKPGVNERKTSEVWNTS
jgi:hypothetical protein